MSHAHTFALAYAQPERTMAGTGGPKIMGTRFVNFTGTGLLKKPSGRRRKSRLTWLALLALPLAGLPMQRSLALPGMPAAKVGDQKKAPLTTCPPNCGTAYTVDSTGDGPHVGAFTQCDDGTGHCTLRAAIQVANFNNGDDGIFFDIPTSDPGYNNGVWTINLGTALPDLTSNINISGPGAAMLVVQRSFTAPTEFRAGRLDQ